METSCAFGLGVATKEIPQHVCKCAESAIGWMQLEERHEMRVVAESLCFPAVHNTSKSEIILEHVARLSSACVLVSECLCIHHPPMKIFN